MPSQRIPCADCEAKKEEIELGGRFTVTGCEPIAGEPDWCLITYERKETAALKREQQPRRNVRNGGGIAKPAFD